ncbi:MAG: diguanylate cyclase domain-containing protein [Planctomycetaceae bacterium]
MPDLDHVTGLEPRSRLHERLERLARGPGPLALVICDVVGLKVVNEREGFLAGDAVLRRAADRLRAAAAGADLAARLGGDELVAVFIGPDGPAAAGRAATVLAASGDPPLRVAAVTAEPNEPPGPLIERLYAAMRRS